MPPKMFERQKSGSVLCSSCGKLVGVNDETCFNCGRSNPSMWGFGGAIRALGRDMGFVRLVIIGSVFLYIATLAVDPSGIRMGGFMSMLSPSQPALFILGASGQYPVFELGRWWTVLSAGWLHGGLIHIGFNMYWVQSLAPAVAEYYGAGRMIIIYTVACITGFVFSSVAMLIYPYIPFGWLLSYVGLAGAQLTIGASASVFGLLGALWYYGRRTGSTALEQQMKLYAIMFVVFGIVMRGVDNQAHLGGFVGGYFVAKFLDPLTPERGDHLLLAVVCIALTAIAVTVSFVTGLDFFPVQ